MSRCKPGRNTLLQVLSVALLQTLGACGDDSNADLGQEVASPITEEAVEDGGVWATEKTSPIGTYQAELFTAQSGCAKASNHAGYTGTGFVDYGSNGTWVEWNNVSVPAAATYKLTFRYAASSKRQAAAIVNGTSRGDLAFASTGGWTSWRTESIDVPLRAGKNSIRIAANTSAGGPNLDSLTLSAIGCSEDSGCRRARSLYTYDFGGLETMSPSDAAKLLVKLGYAGIVPSGRTSSDRARLLQYYQLSQTFGDGFRVFAVMMPHRFEKTTEGLRMEDHKAAIDMMAGRGGQLWVWFRDNRSGHSARTIRDFIKGVVQYANDKRVEIVLYPHVDNIYATAAEASVLVEEFEAMGLKLGMSVNLTHELQAGKGAEVKQTLEKTKLRTRAITLSGSQGVSPFALSLDESVYDTRRYMEGIRDTGFAGPIGFLNWRLSNPSDHLARTMTEWKRLCFEVGLYD